MQQPQSKSLSAKRKNSSAKISDQNSDNNFRKIEIASSILKDVEMPLDSLYGKARMVLNIIKI